MTRWHTRPETPEDRSTVRAILTAAFPTDQEARLVDRLRADPDAWLPGLSLITEDERGEAVAHALLTRCHIEDPERPGRPEHSEYGGSGEPGGAALTLAPCAVLPSRQGTGAGSAAIHAALDAARARGETLVLVLGHPTYYPRFGFVPASRYGIRPPFDAPDQAMMALRLDPDAPVPRGVIRYPEAFGV
ncbi:N-acetyltransferase [Streptomyces sp. NPDC005438]|uniref:GNAT family N-acetyltransferase n=1 Tax=Streptomyces sp. NPDC005438 TaxID=3156880 RepID=UPI0033BE480E